MFEGDIEFSQLQNLAIHASKAPGGKAFYFFFASLTFLYFFAACVAVYFIFKRTKPTQEAIKAAAFSILIGLAIKFLLNFAFGSVEWINTVFGARYIISFILMYLAIYQIKNRFHLMKLPQNHQILVSILCII